MASHSFLPSNDRIRGRLGTLLIVTMSVGILLGYVFGDVMDFTTSALCLLMITNIFLAGVIIIHDSPMYLLRKSRFRVSKKILTSVPYVSGVKALQALRLF